MSEAKGLKYTYEHVPTVRSFARCDKRLRGLMGPFGSGKSSGCVIEILRRAMSQRKAADGIRYSRWAVIRNTYQQLRDTTINTFHDWLPPATFGDWYKAEHRYVINKLEGCRIEVIFRALDRPDQVGNLLSLELTGAWVGKGMPSDYIDRLRHQRTGRYPGIDKGGSWVKGIVIGD